jgi:hypothetical protein
MGRVVYASFPRRLQRRKPDAWRTVSGWIWTLYFIGVLAGLMALAG